MNWLAQCPRHQDNCVIAPSGRGGPPAGLHHCRDRRDRFAAVQRLQQRFGRCGAAQGAGTLIHDGKGMALCNEGKSGMASGGMGDLLSGIIAALGPYVGWSAAEAARLGAVIHGEAADLAAADAESGACWHQTCCPLIGRLVNPDTITS
ncbi:NAD(P)H-hydrate dehydratase [Aeromonas dhakensis]|uniref:NAD(P)H-hydrate dehydratase n=1 Tax=Aeromonas dhakensis TaxID=196024 RepID=UPI00344773E0